MNNVLESVRDTEEVLKPKCLRHVLPDSDAKVRIHGQVTGNGRSPRRGSQGAGEENGEKVMWGRMSGESCRREQQPNSAEDSGV